MKCSKCGFENKEGSKFCMKCGNKLFVETIANEAESGADIKKDSAYVTGNVSAVNIEVPKKSGHKNIIIALSAAAAAVIIGGVFVSSVSKNKDGSDNISVSMTGSTEQTTLSENVTSDAAAKTAVTSNETTAANTELLIESTANNGFYASAQSEDDFADKYYIDRLTDVSYRDYSLYDIFTDVESVARLVVKYSNGNLTFDEFFYNCYYYDWSFGDDGGFADQFSFCVYIAGYHEPAYRIYVPLKEVVPYLKDTFSHNLLPYIYSYSSGNTLGNYANFSGCVAQTDCGIANGVIYCGGSDYTDWKVRYYYNSIYANVWDWYDKLVVDDLSDMVLYEDGGGDYSYIYYRNSGEDCALYRVSLDGSERIKLTDKRASNVRLYNNYIYYSSEKKFWRMNSDGSGKTKIIDAYCYLPSFYNDKIYCISSDDSCLDVYSIDGGKAVDHIYLDSRPMHIDNFFIQSGVLIARGKYTDNEEPFVIITSMEQPDVTVQYSVDCGGINADDDYIYMLYDDNATLCLSKIPLLEFTNTDAVWTYDMPDEFINSYFYLIKYDPQKYYIDQADYEGQWHRLDLE